MTRKNEIPDQYRDFHGSPPRNARRVNLPNPKGGSLMKIGRLTQINYIPENPSMLAGAEYSHKFGDTGTVVFKKNKPILAVDSTGKQLYIINDKSTYKFGPRGIVG